MTAVNLSPTPCAAPTSNQRLRELVTASGLSQMEALKVFNRDLGPAAYSPSAWKAFFSDPASARFRPFKPEALVHAIEAFIRPARPYRASKFKRVKNAPGK